jgi:putative sigma-54 modulation protein
MEMSVSFERRNYMTQQSDALINVSVTFRHTESTPALKSYATDKVMHALKKYAQSPTEVHIILGVEKQNHSAELTVHSKSYDIRSEAVTADLYSAIDKMIDTLIAQLRRQKERKQDHKHVGAAVT